jgi:hypothetical protein
MRIAASAIAVAAAFGLAACLTGFPSPATWEVNGAYDALEAKARQVVENYLRTDCAVGAVDEALVPVLRLGDVVLPYLAAVQRGGPPSVVLKEFQRSLDDTWKRRQEFLKTPEALDLGQESFAMMKAITRNQYVRDQREALTVGYRERANVAVRAMSGRR